MVKNSYKNIHRIIAVALLQAMLLSQLAWAAPSFDCSRNNQDTLSPQLMIKANAFQEAYKIYAFWSKRVPGMEYPRGDFPDAEVTVAALRAVPKQYRTSFHLGQRYDQGGNPKLYNAYKKFRKELADEYGFKLEPYITEKSGLTLKQTYKALNDIPKAKRTYSHLAQPYAKGGNKKLLTAYIRHKDTLLKEFGFKLEKKQRDEQFPDYDAAYKALMSRKPGQRTRKSLNRNKADGGNRILLKACDKFNVKLETVFPQYNDKEAALLALLERPIHLRTQLVLRKSFAEGGNISLFKACRRYNIPLPHEREVHNPYPDALTTLYNLLLLTKEQLYLSILQKSKKYGGNLALYKAYKKFSQILEDKYGFIAPVKSKAQYQSVEDTLVGILKRAPEERYIVSLEERVEDGGDPALALACARFREELTEKYNFELPKKTRVPYPKFEDAFLALMQRPAYLRTAKALKMKRGLGGNEPLLLACRRFKIPLPEGKKQSKYKTAENVMQALFELPNEQRNGLWLAKPIKDGGNPYLRDRYYLLKDEIKEKFDYELPLQNSVYSTFEEAYSTLMARDRELQTYTALKRSDEHRDGALHAACKNMGIPIWDHTLKRYVIISEKKYFTNYKNVDQVYKGLMAYHEFFHTAAFLGGAIENGGNPILFEAYNHFRPELNAKYGFKLRNPKEHVYLTYGDTIRAFFARPEDERTSKFLKQTKKDGGDHALVEACKRFKIKLPHAQKRQAKYPTAEDTLAGILRLSESERNVTDIADHDTKLFSAYYNFKEEIEEKYKYVLAEKRFAAYQSAEQVLIDILSIPEADRFYGRIARKKEDGGNPTLAFAYGEFRDELKEHFNFSLNRESNAVYRTVQEAMKALIDRAPEQRTIKMLNMPYVEGGNKALLYACQRFGIPLRSEKIQGRYDSAEKTLKAYLKLSKEKRDYKDLAQVKEDGGDWKLLAACYRHYEEIKERFNFEIKFARSYKGRKYPDRESAKRALYKRPQGERSVKSLKRKIADGGDWALLDACREFGIKLEPSERETSSKMNGYERFKGLILNAAVDAVNINIYDFWLTMQEVGGHEYIIIRDTVIGIFMPKVIQIAEGNGKYGDATVPMNLSSGAAFNMDDLTNAGMLAIMEALTSWSPQLTIEEDADADSDIEAYIIKKIERAIKDEKKTIYSNKWKEIPLDKPSGNKGGDNSYSGKGQFGGGNKLTVGDKLSSETEQPEDMVSRFEKMQEVIDSMQRGDYGFLEEVGFEFNEKLLLSQKEKAVFIQALKKYFMDRDILGKVPGRFAIWVMGSLGNLGMARRGLSDVNLLVITDTENGQTRQSLLSLRHLIGSGSIIDGQYDNYTLEIGKDAAYRDMMLNSLDFANLIENHQLGNAEDGLATIEAISLNAKGNGDNRALHRAQFHVLENLYQMGSNAVLVLESVDGFSEHVQSELHSRITGKDSEYLYFMSDYLLYFFERQLSKAISAHKFAGVMQKPIQDNQPTVQAEVSSERAQSVEPLLSEDDFKQEDEAFYDDADTLALSIFGLKPEDREAAKKIQIARNNGNIGIRLTDILSKDPVEYSDLWRRVATSFFDKKIFVDPSASNGNTTPEAFEKMEDQADIIAQILSDEAADIPELVRAAGAAWNCAAPAKKLEKNKNPIFTGEVFLDENEHSIDGHADDKFKLIYANKPAAEQALAARPAHKRGIRQLNKSKELGGDPILLDACRYFGIKIHTLQYYDVHAVWSRLQEIPTAQRSAKDLKRKVKDGGDPNLLKYVYKYEAKLKQIYDFELLKDIQHAEYGTAKKAYDALMELPEKQRHRKLLNRNNKDGGNRSLLRWYIEFEDEILKTYDYFLPKEHRSRPAADLSTVEAVYKELMKLKPKQRTMEHLDRTVEEGGDRRLLAACRKFKKQLKKDYKIEIKRRPGIEKLYGTVKATYNALMEIPEAERTTWHLSRSLDEGGNVTLLKAARKFKQQLKKKYDFELFVQESPPLKYPNAKSVYEAIISREKSQQTVKSLDCILEDGGDRVLLDRYYVFEEEIKEEYDYVLERDKGKYATIKAIYEAIMKRESAQQTKQKLDRDKGDGGDRWLLKRIRANEEELKEKYDYELVIEKYKRPLKYPDAKSVYDALMKRKPEAQTVKALKTSKKNGGDNTLLEAYYDFRFEIKRRFNYVMPTANASIYQTVDDTYEALMQIEEGQLTHKKLNRKDKDGGNRKLLKAYTLFKDELLKKYGFVMPKEKRKRTARFQNADDVYKAIMARPEEQRTRLSLRQKKKDGGDGTLIKAYDAYKHEIKEKYGFELPKLIEPLYPDKKSAETALNELPEEDRTAKRLTEMGLDSLRKACNSFDIQLPKEKKPVEYSNQEAAVKALEKLPLRERTSTKLRRKVEDGGNPTLLNACYKFSVRLPREDVMSAYPTYYDAILALDAIPAEDRLPSLLSRMPSRGGNPLLYLAALEYEIELPRDRRKYPNKRLTQMMLNRLPKRLRTSKMLQMPEEEGGVGDYTLYIRCLEFKIPMEKEPSPFLIYRTAEDVYNALMSLPANKRTCSQLMMPKDLGGDPTLYKAFKRHREELKEKFDFTLDIEPRTKYKTKEEAQEALNALDPEDRTASRLLRGIEDGGNVGLYYACRRFEISLPIGEIKRMYATKEAAEQALMARPLEKRYASELVKLVRNGGDPSLYNACCEFNIPLPKIKKDKIYPDVETTFEALMEVPEEERFVFKLHRPKPDGNPSLLKAYYDFRAELKSLYGFEMPSRPRSPYQSAEDVEAALAKRPEDQRTAAALNQPYPQGNRALLRAARRFEVELQKGYAGKIYPDAEAVYKALKQRKEKLNSAKMLNRPIGQGGNRTLLFAYHEFRDQIAEEFGYVVPREKIPGMAPKYPNKESAQKALDERPVGQRSSQSLSKRLDEDGNSTLLAACRRFGVILEKEEPLAGGYDRYRKKIIEAQEGKDINVFDYWLTMQEVSGRERDAIRNVLIEHYMPIIFAKAESGKTATQVDRQRGFSMNQAFNYDDLVNSAVLEVIQGIDAWYPDITVEEDEDANPDLEEFLMNKIYRALKLTRKSIYPNKWKEISISTPFGNKGGNNAPAKSGGFGGGNQLTVGDKLKSETETVDNALVRFEKMGEVLEWFKKGDYSFLQSAINTLDAETAANFDFDESVLVSQKDKIKFREDLYEYFVSKGVLKLIPGEYSIWLMGSMGNVGLARKGLSDVNILIVTDADQNALKDAMLQIRTAIGSGILQTGNDDNIILSIGKEHDYAEMIYNAPDLVGLVDRYGLGNAEKGIASIEIVSLKSPEAYDNRALHRAQFHITEDLYQMGSNGALIAQSEEGVAQRMQNDFRESIAMGNHEYLYFMNDYLSLFFKKQVRKVLAAHAFANSSIKQETVETIPVNEDRVSDEVMRNAELLSPESIIEEISEEKVNPTGKRIKMVRNNGSLSMQLTGVLEEGVDFYREFWQKVALEFDGKEIFIDDPEIDEDKMDIALLVALEAQTDRLYEVMGESVEQVHIRDLSEAVMRRLEMDESLFAQDALFGKNTDEISVVSFDEAEIKKKIGFQSFDLIEQSI